jgi:glycosyltransferase involved in cell wall biosynthesis
MNEQRKNGIKCLLGSIGEESDNEKEIEVRIKTCGVPVHLFRLRKGLDIKGALAIAGFARENLVDIIHCHGYKANILMGVLSRRIRKVPYIVTIHGWTSSKSIGKMVAYEWLDAIIANRADCVIAVSEMMTKDLKMKIAGLKPLVINNGIPCLNFKDGEEYIINKLKEEGGGQDNFFLGAIGRLSLEKGFDLLIRAVAGVVSKGHKLSLALLGHGEERSSLERQVEALGLQGKVHFLGYVPEAYKYMKCFDAFVMSSRTEGLPITLLEAMQAEVPIIATAVGGVPEILEGGGCGRLIRSDDLSALVNAIVEAISSRKMLLARAQRAKIRVHKNYSVKVMEVKYRNCYENILRPS